MKTVSLYRKSDGMLTGQQISLEPWDEAKIAALIPAGHHFVHGEHDHLTRRIDTKTGAVVEHDVEPDAEQRRRESILARARDAAAAQREIDALEARQHRPMRELMVNPKDPLAAAQLAAIHAKIDLLRERVRAVADVKYTTT